MSSRKDAIVSLEFYNPKHITEIIDYFLPEEQLQYTAHPASALQMCELDEERTPIVILFDGKVAGFFVLHGWEGAKEYCDNKDALLLRAYSVNSYFQGKGVASKSMQLLPSFVKEHFPNNTEIILGVNHNNDKAQYVYKKAGFKDKGLRKMGRNGEMLILHLELQ